MPKLNLAEVKPVVNNFMADSCIEADERLRQQSEIVRLQQ